MTTQNEINEFNAAHEAADTRTADERLAQYFGVLARPHNGILPLASDRHAEERAAREYATRAAHHARLHLADAAEVTPASLDAYFAGIFRRLDTESAPSLAAQALAASWQ